MAGPPSLSPAASRGLQWPPAVFFVARDGARTLEPLWVRKRTRRRGRLLRVTGLPVFGGFGFRFRPALGTASAPDIALLAGAETEEVPTQPPEEVQECKRRNNMNQEAIHEFSLLQSRSALDTRLRL